MKTATASQPPVAKRRAARHAAPDKRPTIDGDELDLAPELIDLNEEPLDLDEDGAAPEAATTGEPSGTVADEAVPVENEEDDDDADPEVERLLTGILDSEQATAEDDDWESSGSGIEDVPTARRDEFVCAACFLIWNRRHLADPEHRLCGDCVDDAPHRVPTPAAAA